ncbi:hypothetical protein P3T16_000291 [Paraburkholderia sp. GAS42]
MRNFGALGLHSSGGATAIFTMGKNLAPFFCSEYYASRATEKAGTMALPTPSLTKFVVLELQLITVLADRPLHSVIETAGCFSLDLQRHTNFHPKPLREQHQDLLGHVRELQLGLDRVDIHGAEESRLLGSRRGLGGGGSVTTGTRLHAGTR